MERIDDDGLRWLNLWRQERRIASDEKLLQRRMSSLQLLLLIASLAPFVACQSFPQDEVSALNAFKEAIYEDPLLVLSNWNVVDVNPFSPFVACSGIFAPFEVLEDGEGDEILAVNGEEVQGKSTF
ncbi:hypothetical protein LINPERPRIM_LOCUS19946 [Linum perenne]